MRGAWMALLVSIGAVACDRDLGDERRAAARAAETRGARLAQRLREPGVAEGDSLLARWKLPDWLNEISGIVELRDGSLVAHGDENARLAVIDPRTGIVMSRFALGRGDITGDFEGITLVGDTLQMLTSDGKIFQFAAGTDGANVPFRVVDTGLGKVCEFEAITYEPDVPALLLACKRIADASEKGRVLIYRVPLPLRDSPGVSRIELALGENDKGKPRTFEASDLTRDPVTGRFVVLASRERSILEFTADGTVSGIVRLPAGKSHEQPEGIAITHDSLLVVSDEAVSGAATLSVYRWPLRGMRETTP